MAVTVHKASQVALLSAILKGTVKANEFKPTDFSDPDCAEAFKVMQKDMISGRPTIESIAPKIDPSLLEMIQNSKGEKVTEIASIIKKNAIQKKIKECAKDILLSEKPDRQAMKLQGLLMALKNVDDKKPRAAAEILEEYLENPEPEWGVPYGLESLDAWTRGMRRGSLIFLAGRPRMGKTSLATQIAIQAALSRRVVFFSLEMRARQILEKAICNLTDSPPEEIRKRGLSPHIKEQIITSGLIIDDSPRQTPNSIRKTCLDIQSTGGIDLVIIDHKKIMRSDKRMSRIEEVEDISRELKLVARDLDIPILCLDQFSRDIEKRKDKRPMLSDLWGSGEHDADVVILLHRYKGKTEIILEKNRDGPTGSMDVTFIPECTKFVEEAECPF